MSMGGGGGGGGGAVVGGPSSAASYAAGNIQSQAAKAAADAATKQTNMAINMIRDQYNNAFMSLKPYTMEGIQALDQLNQYMGLTAYNPGTAPTAPIKPTIDSLMQDITRSDVRNYAAENTRPAYNNQGTFFGNYLYEGAGSDQSFAGAIENRAGGAADGWTGSRVGNMLIGSGPNSIANNPNYAGAIRQELASDQLPVAMKDYNSQMAEYNQQMDVYNYAKQLQAQYDAAGPLTPDQVAAKLAQTPGYQFQLGQGMDAIQRAAASKGMVGSGRLLQSLVDYGQGMASQTYGDTLSRLAALAGAGQNAATNQAQGSMQLGNITGQLTNQLGDTLANSFLASGNAKAQALLAANQQYKVIGGNDGGGGLGGIGSVLGGLGSLASGMSGLFG